jgi:hypothetical protein
MGGICPAIGFCIEYDLGDVFVVAEVVEYLGRRWTQCERVGQR